MEGNCPVCGKRFMGRSDKKFCSDMCRNEYNNTRKRHADKMLSRLDGALRMNRSILKNCSDSGLSDIDKEILALKHFNFEIFTSARFRLMKPTVYSCYDFEYFTTKDGIVHIRNISGRLNVYL